MKPLKIKAKIILKDRKICRYYGDIIWEKRVESSKFSTLLILVSVASGREQLMSLMGYGKLAGIGEHLKLEQQ